ncbi:PEP-utilizing enzyme [Nocardia takedensis]
MSSRTSVEETLDNSDIDPALTWTTGNVAEAFPGVFTTLGFTYMSEPMELAFRKMFFSLGVYTRQQVYLPDQVEDMFWTLFAGRAAANIDRFREIANVTPGTSATAIEQQLFGYVRPETVDKNSVRRYPTILTKAPGLVLRLPGRHDAEFADLRRWRLDRLAEIDTLDHDGVVAVLEDARGRFHSIMIKHLVVAFVSSALADGVSTTLKSLNLGGLEADVLSGVGSDENEVAHDLWALAHEEISQQEFIDRHGYHGVEEGQLSGVSWREDPAPILERLEHYRTIPAESPRAPRNRSCAQVRARDMALDQLLDALPGYKRPISGWQVRMAGRWLALREQGKAGYLLTYDVARAAMRREGGLLAADGVLDDTEDIFHLSYDQLRAGITGIHRGLIAERRAAYNERLSYRLPQAWSGMPELIKFDGAGVQALAANGSLTGVAASAGVVEGRARVVRDPADVELDEGDILVCEVTDPSWVPLFLVASGVVTDHGGMLSHGPIVARELGIPCVCGTKHGSHKIADGARIRLDGNAGTVTVLS